MNSSDQPSPFLQTERLLLRPLTMEDLEFVFQHFGHPQVAQYLLDEEPVTEISQAREIIQFYLDAENKPYNRWGIAQKSTGQLMGTCGFHKWNKRSFRAEIGYDLYPDFWGQGYMTEALQKVIAHGFGQMNLHRIEALIYVENKRSMQLLKKIGFKEEGVLLDYFALNGEFYDHAVYSLLNDDRSFHWKGLFA